MSVRKRKEDTTHYRGDIHILLVGDPGVAKSVMLKFISTTSPKGRYIAGKAATSAGLTATVSSITKEELLDERRAELAFENQRFFDLVRFGVANEVLSTFASANGYTFSGTDLLLPIPQREIGLSNGLLSQNPGY